jgi:gamma-glutamyltranspeptidase / glutathione hydrolase
VKRFLGFAALLPMALHTQQGPRTQARSMPITKYGIVATSQTLASAAGVKILEAGGTAVDAAIAANAVLGLVEPISNGIGGDLFAIVYQVKTGKLYGMNASGWAPAGMTLDFIRSQGHSDMPGNGIHSVTVPGAVAGWDALHKRFGHLPMSALMAPAIHYAREGFPVTEIISNFWKSSDAKLGIVNNHAIKVFLPNGRGLEAGEIFRNPDLAQSLTRIAQSGRDGFYKGATAAAIVAVSKEHGGAIRHEDLAEFEPEWVDPISTTYRGWRVSELPPNGQGVAALAMLNIMEQFPLAEYGHNSSQALHILIEAKKLAYADLLRYVGDPRMMSIPVVAMVSKRLAESRAKLIDDKRASCNVVPSELISLANKPGADTIYLSVVDREGNMVSLIQSNYKGFGSGIVPPASGFGLHNRAGLFTLEPGQPNTLAPRKRPLHTIIPGFMSKGDIRIAFGIMGGWNQAQAHAQYVSNVVDHGMNIQAAMEAPRFTKLTFEGCDVQIESRIPEATREQLTGVGHMVKGIEPYSSEVGGGQAVMIDDKGVRYGASDPRKDGAAIPESPRFRTPATSRKPGTTRGRAPLSGKG